MSEEDEVFGTLASAHLGILRLRSQLAMEFAAAGLWKMGPAGSYLTEEGRLAYRAFGGWLW